MEETCFQNAPKAIYVGYAPRSVVEARLKLAAPENSERFARLKRLFRNVGCVEPLLSEQEVKDAALPNLICTLHGRIADAIVVGAHFDKVQEGDGVADNWSGASLLPSLYQSLGTRTRRYTFKFVSFTGEEVGLVGSKDYVRYLTSSASPVRAMVNLDTLGWSSTNVEVRRSDAELVCHLRVAANMWKETLQGMDAHAVGVTDAEPFRRAGVPSISIHSVDPDFVRLLHSRRDTLATISLDRLYSTYRVVAVYLAVLDAVLEPRTAADTSPPALTAPRSTFAYGSHAAPAR